MLRFDILAEMYLLQNINYHNSDGFLYMCVYIHIHTLFIMPLLYNERRKLESTNWVTKSRSRCCQKIRMEMFSSERNNDRLIMGLINKPVSCNCDVLVAMT